MIAYYTLCLGAPQIRFTNLIQNTGGNGQVQFSINFNQLPNGASFSVGDDWNFQFWYRDFVLFPTSNTTAAIEITFQ